MRCDIVARRSAAAERSDAILAASAGFHPPGFHPPWAEAPGVESPWAEAPGFESRCFKSPWAESPWVEARSSTALRSAGLDGLAPCLGAAACWGYGPHPRRRAPHPSSRIFFKMLPLLFGTVFGKRRSVFGL